MSNAKHTPGPWKYDGDGFDSCSAADCGTEGYTVMDDDCFPICQIDDRIDDDECEANARLIAAAPELLDALQKAVCDYIFHITKDGKLARVLSSGNSVSGLPAPYIWPQWLIDARAAIAKATCSAS